MQGCAPCMNTNERLMEPEIPGTTCLMPPPPPMQSYHGTSSCITLLEYWSTFEGNMNKL